jgi:hypothetical protein
MTECDFPGVHCNVNTEWDPTAIIAMGLIVIISVLLVKKIASMIRNK